jgi:hypothetical protein
MPLIGLPTTSSSLIFGRNAKLKRSLAVGSDILPGSTFSYQRGQQQRPPNVASAF